MIVVVFGRQMVDEGEVLTVVKRFSQREKRESGKKGQ